MTDETREITITLPADLRTFVEQRSAEEGVSVDEFVRLAVERAIRLGRLEESFCYGRAKAKEMGITVEDVPRLIAEYRAEKKATASR